jgi:O-antigen/teichoic acid export membrane protein
MILAAGLLFSFSPFIISLFLRHDSGHAILLLRVFCLAPVIVCLHIPASQLLMANNQKKSYLCVLTWATVINIVCNLLLVQVWGSVGTVISVLLTELFITIGFNRQLFKNKLAGYLSTRLLNLYSSDRHANQ